MRLLRIVRYTLARLPPIAQALLWMIIAAVTGGIMNVLIRVGAEELDPLEVVFFRNLFALLFMVPFLARAGTASLRTSKMGFYALRALVAFISMITWFIGVNRVPLATATSLNFTAPLFATVLAAVLLHEQVRMRRWSAIAIGFIGVIVILRPFHPIDGDMLLLLLSAATAAMGSITVKFLSRSEGAATIVAYMVIYLTPMSLIPALFVWTWPSLWTIFAMLMLGFFGVASHLAVAKALSVADASATAPFEFLRLPYAAFLGYVFYGERPDIWSWVGAGIIIGSSLYVAHREARLARQSPTRVSGGRPRPLTPS
jgi:drug/metabolite transporter (DMT)-like permease